MMLLALLAAAQVGPTDDVIGPRIDETKTLLSHFGVKGSLRLESASPGLIDSKGPDVVVLHDDNGTTYHAYFPQKQKLPYGLFRGEEREDFPSFPLTSVHDLALETLAWSWVKQVRGRDELRLEGIDEDKHHRARVTFGLTIHGYPFFRGFSWFGYSFVLNTRTRSFLAYSSSIRRPQVVYHAPELSESQALSAAQREFDTVVAPKALKDHGWHLALQFRKPNQLGFDALPGESVAHLWWVLPYTTTGETGAFTKRAIGGAIYVDAVTGTVYDPNHSVGSAVDRVNTEAASKQSGTG